MELIDRNEAIKAIDDMLMEDEQYKVWLKLSIKNIKPVNAIPVSLIQSEIDFLTLAAEGEMEVTGQHGEVYAELAELKKLMSLWENERETQNGQTD